MYQEVILRISPLGKLGRFESTADFLVYIASIILASGLMLILILPPGLLKFSMCQPINEEGCKLRHNKCRNFILSLPTLIFSKHLSNFLFYFVIFPKYESSNLFEFLDSPADPHH